MTRLGPHILPPGSSGAKVLADAGAPVVKMVDTFDSSYDRPAVTVIGRRVSTYPADPGRVITAENLRQAHGPQEAAGIWVDVQKPTYAANSFVKIWEGPNEPAFTDDATAMAWYGAFEAERTRLLAGMGLRAAIGCFSYGTPDVRPGHLDGWMAFLPALRAANANGGILALHEYNDGPLTTAQVDPDGTGWLTFRYRKVIRDVLTPNGLGALPIVLSEFGRFNFRQRLTDAAYAADLLAADLELRKDSSVIGATIFTCGSNNTAWDPFNLDNSQVPFLLASAWKSEPAPTPTPTPTGGTVTNLIPNPDFSQGYHQQDGIIQLAIPNGARLAFVDGTDDVMQGESVAVKPARPETVVWPWKDCPPAERDQYFHQLSASPEVYEFPFALKEFKPWAPADFTTIWTAANVPAGMATFSVDIFPDMYMWDAANSKKKYQDDPATRSADYLRHAHFQLAIGDTLGPWLNLGAVPCGKYTNLVFSTVVPAAVASLDVKVRVQCLFPLDNNGVFLRKPSLSVLAAAGGDTTTPTTTPGAGTLRSVALKLKSDAARLSAVVDEVQQLLDLIG